MSGDSTKVGELFVAVGFELDKGDLKKVEAQTEKFVEKLERQAVIKPTVSHREQREAMRREAALWKSSQIAKQRIHERMALESHNRLSRRIGRGVKGQLTKKRSFGAGLGMMNPMGMAGMAPLIAGFGAAKVFGDELKFDESMNRLDISSRGAMGPMGDVRNQILAVSRASSVAKEDILGAAASFTALTGDGKAAAALLGTFAKMNVATGSSMEDISASAASMTQQLGITVPEMDRAFSILIAGGKAGKIEIKDMAALMASLGASFKPFGESQGIGGLSTLGAAFQVTAQNFGSASEAATGLEALMGSLQRNAKKLKDAKINVFEADGKTLKPMLEIVDQLTSKDFNETKLFDLLGRKEAITTLRALRDNRQMVDEIAKSTRNAKDLEEDNARMMQSNAVKLKKAWNDLKVTISEALTPERIAAFTRFLEMSIGVAAKLVDTLSNVPGYVEFLHGEGQVANQDRSDAFEDYVRKVTGKHGEGAAGITPQDMTKVAEQLAGKSASDLAIQGIVGGLARDIIEGAKRRRSGEKASRQKDIDVGRGQFRGMGTGDRLSPDHYAPEVSVDEPFRYDPGPGAGGPSVTVGGTKVDVNVTTGADPDEIGRAVGDAVRKENERAARDIAAAAGQ
jgi:TP901 family phage tail tape measure protein